MCLKPFRFNCIVGGGTLDAPNVSMVYEKRKRTRFLYCMHSMAAPTIRESDHS